MGSKRYMTNNLVQFVSSSVVYILFQKPKVYMFILLSGSFLLFTVVYNYTQTDKSNSVVESIFWVRHCDYDLMFHTKPNYEQ